MAKKKEKKKVEKNPMTEKDKVLLDAIGLIKQLDQRINRIVAAISQSKSVKGM
ncbi:hypothetical protein LCGC14_1221120 [marine sediment metagenome]|uniref:Uncharacterized protein n=1 Tax=marine sediment metagenome TaxID=412755 RepID=A0A0F9LF78_9ZZZZ